MNLSVVSDVAAWFGDSANWQGDSGIWARLGEHVLLTLASVVAAMVVALPIALWLGHVGKGGALAVNVSNIGRAVPTFAVLAILAVGVIGTASLGPFGRAGAATLVALFLFALPPLVTNSYVGVREVDRDLVEAARGMGMSGWEVFRRVELPLARPLIMTGVRLAVVQVWATATIAALVAGPGLGNIIRDGFAFQDQAQVIGGAVVVAGLALVLELILAVVQKRSDPLRATRTEVRPVTVSTADL